MTPFQDWLSDILADPKLTKCFKGHDHQKASVVGSFHERVGPGRRPLLSFHCPDCGMATGQGARKEYWREHKTIEIAMAQGNVLPCALCFPRLSKKFDEKFRSSRGRSG